MVKPLPGQQPLIFARHGGPYAHRYWEGRCTVCGIAPVDEARLGGCPAYGQGVDLYRTEIILTGPGEEPQLLATLPTVAPVPQTGDELALRSGATPQGFELDLAAPFLEVCGVRHILHVEGTAHVIQVFVRHVGGQP